MKFPIFCLFVLITSPLLRGQQPLDTLHGNERQVLSLFFESPIQKAVVGAPSYAFTFNRENPEPLGLLQATPGPKSNLLVLTQDGGIYSFVVAYRDSITDLTRFVPATQSLTTDSIPKSTEDTIPRIPPKVPQICEQLLERKTTLKPRKRQLGIRLMTSAPFYHEGRVYLTYGLENRTGIDYQIEALTLLKVLGNTARKSSFQEQELTPIYRHQFPGTVPQGSTMRFVVVYPKFTLGPNESVAFRLTEKQGSRNIRF